MAGKHGILPNIDRKLRFKLSVNDVFTNFPKPSVVFKNILPVKPSVTTASTLPEKASLPSILPIKFIPNSSDFSFNNSYDNLVNSLPFVSSVPIFNKPMAGFSIPKVFLNI